MICGASMWAILVGNAAGLVTLLNVHRNKHHQTMDELDYLIRDQRISGATAARLRQYFHAIKEQQRAHSYQTLVEAMSPTLQVQLLPSAFSSSSFCLQLYARLTPSSFPLPPLLDLTPPLIDAPPRRRGMWLSRRMAAGCATCGSSAS